YRDLGSGKSKATLHSWSSILGQNSRPDTFPIERTPKLLCALLEGVARGNNKLTCVTPLVTICS
ncbi:MAG: hypothetical protein WCJ49_04155, partial [Deltaproteobacteria bacterium]